MSESVLGPTLRALSKSQTQLASLEDHIKAKDHVISKLLDRISNQSVDMSMIFPTLTGVGGRKGTVSVDMAKQRISGMAAFDHASWQKEFEDDGDVIGGIGELVKGADKSRTSTESDSDWTKNLPGSESLSRPNQSQNGRLSLSQSQSMSQRVTGSDEDTESEDEFERAVTPPSLRKKRPSPEVSPEEKESSQSSDDGGEAPPTKRQKTSQIGGIGKRKAAATSEPIPDSSSFPVAQKRKSPTPRRRKSDVAEATDATEPTSSASDSDKQPKPTIKAQSKASKLGTLRKKSATPASPIAGNSPPSSPPARPPSSQASTPSHRLGRLGKGRQRTATASPAPEDKEASQPTTPSRRLGRIGIKKQTQSPIPEAAEPDSATASEDDDLDAPIHRTNDNRKPTSPEARSRPSSKRSKSPEPNHQPPAPSPSPKQEETEEQKAARKKEELNKKIASGPAKKKRRF